MTNPAENLPPAMSLADARQALSAGSTELMTKLNEILFVIGGQTGKSDAQKLVEINVLATAAIDALAGLNGAFEVIWADETLRRVKGS